METQWRKVASNHAGRYTSLFSSYIPGQNGVVHLCFHHRSLFDAWPKASLFPKLAPPPPPPPTHTFPRKKKNKFTFVFQFNLQRNSFLLFLALTPQSLFSRILILSESDQCQISPAASPEILHHTVLGTWLFIACSDKRWLYYTISHYLAYTFLLKRLGECTCYHWRWRTWTRSPINAASITHSFIDR